MKRRINGPSRPAFTLADYSRMENDHSNADHARRKAYHVGDVNLIAIESELSKKSMERRERGDLIQ